MEAGRSLTFRAVAAVGLMIAFFAMAILAAALLASSAYGLFASLPELRGRAILFAGLLALACVAAALVIIWSVLPRIDRFRPPGPELSEEDAPELFAEVRSVAEATGQAPPRHVYLAGDVNAFVSERGGIMGLGSRRVMGIGLPLLEILNVSQLRAVIAHEFGHFYGGDTKLGPWIYKTRGAVARTVINLERAEESTAEITTTVAFVMKLVRAPFSWFGTTFMRITQAISRAQELAADALAARVVGSTALIEGLKRTHSGALAFEDYFNSELAPLLQDGYRPPIAEGYRRFVSVESNAIALRSVVETEMREGEGEAFDSHPPLRERVARLEDLAIPARLEDDRRAIELLADVGALEGRLAATIFVEGEKMRPVSWEELPTHVFVPTWRKHVDSLRPHLAGATPATLEREASRLRELGRRCTGTFLWDVADEQVAEWAVNAFGCALAMALIERSWTIHSSPGEPLSLVSGERHFEPFIELSAFMANKMERTAWTARMRDLEIADVDLGAVSTRPTPD